jgi:integrase
MPLLNLTDAALRSLRPDTRQTFFDTATPGFAVRATPRGSRTFVIVYGPEKARKWEKIGTYPLLTLSRAREEARNRLSLIQLGLRTDKPTLGFTEAYEQFLASYKAKNRPKTVYEMERIVKRHLMPKLRRKMVAEITTAELNEIIDKLLSTPAECAAAFTAARTIFRWLSRRRSIARSPLENVPVPVKTQPRARVLTDDELGVVWHACHTLGNINPELATIVKLLMLTGQRKGQIAKLRGEWIDREGKIVIWPAEHMKGNRQHTLPLAPTVMGILASLPKTGFLFRARGRSTPFNGFSTCKAVFDERAKIAPWTLHDLRRTFSTGIARLGVAPHIKEMLLAHSTAKDPVEAIYDLHTYEGEMREALEKWETHLRALIVAAQLQSAEAP